MLMLQPPDLLPPPQGQDPDVIGSDKVAVRSAPADQIPEVTLDLFVGPELLPNIGGEISSVVLVGSNNNDELLKGVADPV